MWQGFWRNICHEPLNLPTRLAVDLSNCSLDTGGFVCPSVVWMADPCNGLAPADTGVGEAFAAEADFGAASIFAPPG